MVTLRDSLLSSSARSLSIRQRPDLIARRHHYLGRTYWIVKDPVGLNYFRFQEEEYALLNWLDGNVSLDEIKDRFEEEFPPQKITLEELQQFLGMLHRSGLVITGVGGQGKELLKRRRERRRKEFLGALANILCIRFKGIDPERILTWLYPLARWFYTPWAVSACIMLGLSALTLVAVQFNVFMSRLPAFHEFFNFQNALLLSVTLGVTKVLHEFGHGLTCKHFGGECHELGVMFLVLTPCLYCNVSDSWLLPNKWARAAIGAGGMYVELILASIATWIWWFSDPGLLNHLCLNVMFVCSVSTLIFNANPLLRYDGYYILSDIMEIPNLRQKSTAVLSRKAGEWFLGLEQPDDPFLPERNQVFFALYSVASAIYQWVVVYSILFFLYHFLKPYKVEVLGKMLAMASLWGLIVMPLYQLGKFFYVPGRLEKVKKVRMYTSLAVVIAVLLFVFFIPLPHTVMAVLEIQPHAAKQIYVDSPKGGLLTEVDVEAGQEVKKGEKLGVLVDRDLDFEISKLEGQESEYKASIESVQRIKEYDSGKSSQETIPQLEKGLKSIRDRLALQRGARDRLTLRSDRDGTVLPPPYTPAKHQTDAETGPLPSWSGTPLDEENHQPFLKDGVLVCQVGDPRSLEAILVIDQGDIEYVQKGQTVDLKIDSLPYDTLHGTIEEVSIYDLKITPQKLSNKTQGELASTTDPDSGVERPQNPSYEARVPISDNEGVLQIGLRGRAKIHTAPLSLGARLWRLIMNTFNFRLD
jgi:putative peptide zinc metalloprotease protein